MSKNRTTKIPVTLTFELIETGSYPPINGIVHICAMDPNGQEWKTQIKYDGNEEGDVIQTLTRMSHFPKAITAMVMAASPTQIIEVKPEQIKKQPDSFEALAGSQQEPPMAPPQETREEAQIRRRIEQREEFYKQMHGDLQKKSYAELRMFVQSNDLNMPIQNGKDMKELADEICQKLRDKEDKVRHEKD